MHIHEVQYAEASNANITVSRHADHKLCQLQTHGQTMLNKWHGLKISITRSTNRSRQLGRQFSSVNFQSRAVTHTVSQNHAYVLGNHAYVLGTGVLVNVLSG